MITDSKLLWRIGLGEWIIGKGTHTATTPAYNWEGTFFIVGCPWLQIRFERFWEVK